MDIITCDGIVKRFNGFTALDKVSIAVPKGTIFGFLGPNGAGKTTLLRIINQITLPDSGNILFKGSPIRPEDVAYIGYMPEERGLYKKMKIGEQALYLAQLKGMSRVNAIAGLKKWFVKFEIQGWWDRKVEELSKGMAQKVQFIITVLHNPALLILDEPFSGFDPVNTQLIRNEILKMKEEGTSVILSTHNMESVEELCDDIALINKSKLIISGSLDDIRKNHGKNKIEVIYRRGDKYMFKKNSLFAPVSQNETKNGYRAVLDVNRGVCSSEILRTLIQEIDVVSYKELIPRMNDIFIKLVS